MEKGKDNAQAPFAKSAQGKQRAPIAQLAQGKRRFAEGKRGGGVMGAVGLARVTVFGGHGGCNGCGVWVQVWAEALPTGGETANPGQPPFMSAVAGPPPNPADEAPPAEKTGGFDGKLAYEQVVKQLSYGPRPAGSPALAKLQEYLESELKSYGCA